VNANVITRLESRRKNVAATLEHLRDQLMEVENNTEWKDLWAQRRRNELLAELLGWYDGRLRRIDHVLDQAAVRRKSRF
jgi:predicted kinase